MNRQRWILAIVVLLLATPSTGALAQGKRPLQQGDVVRIQVVDRDGVVNVHGVVVAADEEALYLEHASLHRAGKFPARDVEVRVPLRQISKLEVKRDYRSAAGRHTVNGAVVGAFLGGMVVGAAGSGPTPCRSGDPGADGGAVFAGAFVGAAVGAFIGAALGSGDRVAGWRKVRVDRIGTINRSVR